MVSLSQAAMLFALSLSGMAHADTVKLKSGHAVEGTIVKRTDKQIWIDIGPTIVELGVESVAEVIEDDEDANIVVRGETLFRVAENLPELPPREHAKRIGPAVIKVSTAGGLGSGVIINPSGYAITNAHVIQGETDLKATVWFPHADSTLKRTIIDNIEIIAVNSHLDLALIRIPHPQGEDFTFAPLEMDESIQVGQEVFIIGNPLGLERTLSQGVISTTQRNFDGITYVQTDTAINPGNSGGPMFNTLGEVIGITNMKLTGGDAIGFAIPTRYVKDFIRNREAFAFDKDNPNSGHNYHAPPPRSRFGVAPQLRDRTSEGGD